MKARLIHGMWTCVIRVAVASAQTPTYNIVYSFNGTPDGAGPTATLIHDAAGNFYGTTYAGGANGFGSVFKIDNSGQETVLYNFTGGSDGANPLAPLRFGPNGGLFGTASAGGTGPCGGGCGVVFELDSSGNETVLYSFQGGVDGLTPEGAIVLDGAGNIYGSTAGGGTFGVGNVFKLDSAGNETNLVNFTGTNGSGPSGLIRDQAGNLYGTAATGGSGAGCIGGCGVIFKVDASGHQTILYNFAGTNDGAFPLASLVRDSVGNLYGTTFDAGRFGFGTVFRLNSQGNFRTLYSFHGAADGANSGAELLRDQQGDLYGTTESGGTGSCSGGCGVVFKVSPGGNESVLHTFQGGPDGNQPTSGLVAGAGASLWGTTFQGGVNDHGIVFELQ